MSDPAYEQLWQRLSETAIAERERRASVRPAHHVKRPSGPWADARRLLCFNWHTAREIAETLGVSISKSHTYLSHTPHVALKFERRHRAVSAGRRIWEYRILPLEAA